MIKLTTFLKRLSVSIPMLLLCLFVIGCGKSLLPPLSGNSTILAFGDSLTEGVGVDIDDSYPSLLEKISGIKVVNSGVSGETTTEGKNRFPSVLSEFNPDLVILLEGGNDILRNQSLEETKSNLAAMIEMAQLRGIPVILLGVPQKSLFSDSAPLYRELAERYQLVSDLDLIADLQRSPAMKSDAVHFNEKGYKRLAEGVYELLQNHGAIR